MKSAAAVITLASMSFSSPQAAKNLSHSIRRAHGITKGAVDSTPRLVTKLDKLYNGSSVITNEGAENGPIPLIDQPESPKSVSEVIVNTAAVAPVEDDVTSQDTTLQPAADQSGGGQPSGNITSADVFRAAFDFNASSDEELTLKVGDIVTVMDKTDSGWWKGQCGDKSGWFPESYVVSVTTPTEEVHQDRASSPTPSSWERDAAGR